MVLENESDQARSSASGKRCRTAVADGLIVPIGIRDRVHVLIAGLPDDLTAAEAAKISAVIMSHVDRKQ